MRVFRHRDFRFFWGTRVLGFLAIEMMITTVGWQVWRITGRELDLGLVGLAQFAPFAALFLISGLVADRVLRMRIIRACIAVQTVCAIGLIWLSLTGADNFTLILLLLILFGTSRAFQNPAQQAIVPNLVPKEDLPNAIAWSATGFQTARVVGPTISGILIAIGARFDQDETWVYGLVAIAFVIASWLAWNVRAPVQIVNRDPVTVTNLLAGLKFITSRKVILGAISLDLFAVLFGGALALLPVYATDILKVDAEGFGILRSTFTVGALVGALYLTQRPIKHRAGLKLLLAVGGFGAGAIVFGLSDIFWLSLERVRHRQNQKGDSQGSQKVIQAMSWVKGGQPWMTRPYSEDLRERVVRVVESGTSRNAAAKQFDVSISFVVKLMQRWKQRGTIKADKYGGWKKSKLAPHGDRIRALVMENCDITIDELCVLLAAEGIEAKRSTLGDFLLAQGLSRKKRQPTPPSRSALTSRRREPLGATSNLG